MGGGWGIGGELVCKGGDVKGGEVEVLGCKGDGCGGGKSLLAWLVMGGGGGLNGFDLRKCDRRIWMLEWYVVRI